jgi:hypothetical protein
MTANVEHLRHMRRHFSRAAKKYRKIEETSGDCDEREIAVVCVENCERLASEYRELAAQAEERAQ